MFGALIKCKNCESLSRTLESQYQQFSELLTLHRQMMIALVEKRDLPIPIVPHEIPKITPVIKGWSAKRKELEKAERKQVEEKIEEIEKKVLDGA